MYFLLAVFVLPAFIISILQMSFVQAYVAHRFSNKLSEDLHTEVNIGSVNINLYFKSRAKPAQSSLIRAFRLSKLRRAIYAIISLKKLAQPIVAKHHIEVFPHAGVDWCGRGDSNPYRISPTAPSKLRVCQFHHFRK